MPPTPNAGRKGPGRPGTNIVEVATQKWDQFCEAGAGSIFFGSAKSVSCARAVARYIEKRKAKKDCELASKRLQVIDHAMKIGAKWLSRRATGPASKDFLELWNQLLQSCENDPKTPLSNKYMWSLCVQVRSCSGVVDVLKEVSLLTSHQDVFDDLHATHRQFIEQCVTNAMNSAGAAPSSVQEKQCIDHLTSMLRPLLANQGPALGNAGVTNQVPAMGNKAADQGAAHQGSALDACAGTQAGCPWSCLMNCVR
jgi:hypothetical protein